MLVCCSFLTCIVSAGTPAYGSWTEITSNASFSPRESFGAAVFDNRLWVIGGRVVPNELANDVWSSPDGKTWALETEHAEFSPRTYSAVTVFNNRLWVIGGSSAEGDMNDVWSSADGKTWNREIEHAGFSPRCRHGVTVFDNRLWVIGGSYLEDGYEVFTNDVWSSADGKTWNREAEHAGFSPRWGTGAVAFDNLLWMITGAASSDVWSSPDGKTWSLVNGDAPFSSADHTRVSVFKDRLFVVGTSSDSGVTNDVWSSPDGKNWTVEKVRDDFGTRAFNKVVAFNNGLFAIGGFDSLNSARDKNDVWYLPLQVPVQTPAPAAPISSNVPSAGPAVQESSAKAGLDLLIVCFSLLLASGVCGHGFKRAPK